MNGQAPVKPLRFIVEATTTQIQELVQPLLAWLTPRATAAPPRPEPDPDDEDDDEPAPLDQGPELAPDSIRGQAARNLPPPVAHSPPMPVMPDHVSRTRMLGKPCHKNHRYQNSAYCLRKRSNNGCVECERERDLARKKPAVRPLAPVTPRAPALPPPETRPVLPAHLQARCFLSPIGCANAQHRYRGTLYTLRFTESEDCVMCVTPQFALAGD